MLSRILKKQFVALFGFAICAVSISAQPLGNEPSTIRRMVGVVQTQIAETDKLIFEKPKDAELYAKRAALYVEIYRLVYKTYYGAFYGEKPNELKISAIASKAIADYGKAISISPRVEWFAGRGEMFALRWNDFTSNFNWYEEINKREPSEWSDLIEWRTLEKEVKVFEKFLGNTDFAAAVADYEKVLNLTNDAQIADKSHQTIARLYLHRAVKIFYNLDLSRNSLIEPNAQRFSILNEIDIAVSNLSKISSEKRLKENSHHVAAPVTLRSALFDKASFAAHYSKNDVAIAALNAAEKYVDVNAANDDFACQFYPFRSSLYVKIDNFDAALTDANVRFQNEICPFAYKPRGDALFGKGDFSAAVENYTKQLSETNYDYNKLSDLYKKRGEAHLKLSETEKAIADFTQFINYTSPAPEGYQLRAQAFRRIGKEAADEKRVLEIAEMQKILAIKRSIYGKVVMPEGVALDAEKIWVRVSYVAKPALNSTTSIDEKGRFYITNLPPGDFRLFAYIDGTKDGIAVRFYGLSDEMNLEDKLVGPIVLKLDRTVILAKQPTNLNY